MTMAQIINAFNGYYDRESERTKATNIIMWESIRWQTFILFNLGVTKKGRLSSPKKIDKVRLGQTREAK